MPLKDFLLPPIISPIWKGGSEGPTLKVKKAGKEKEEEKKLEWKLGSKIGGGQKAVVL